MLNDQESIVNKSTR